MQRVVSVADILPYYFLLANTAALLTEVPLQLYSTQHTTEHKANIPTPNPTTAKPTGGKRSHDGCRPGTLCGHRELCSDRLVARLSTLSCLGVLLHDDLASLDNMNSSTVHTAMPHLSPPDRKPPYILCIEDETGSRASHAVLL